VKGVAKDYLSYLSRYLDGTEIRNPQDLQQIASKVTRGWNFFARSVRALINYHLEKGLISKEFALDLKSIVKRKPDGIDVKIPSDEEVKRVLSKIYREDMKLVGLLCLFSGIRVREAVRLLNEFDESKPHIENSIAYYELGWLRGSKLSFHVFMPRELALKLKRVEVFIIVLNS